jgi:excisionase family DNA binding protein
MNDSDPAARSAANALGRFLTLADTAEVLNISASQAYALVRSGELPAIKIGGHGHWRVERAVLESYIEAKYEEARRMSLWNQSDYASLDEHSFGGGDDHHAAQGRATQSRATQSRTDQGRSDQSRTTRS